MKNPLRKRSGFFYVGDIPVKPTCVYFLPFVDICGF
jgi:hypothetical protein